VSVPMRGVAIKSSPLETRMRLSTYRYTYSFVLAWETIVILLCMFEGLLFAALYDIITARLKFTELSNQVRVLPENVLGLMIMTLS
jgi:hypothetical protein